MIIQGEMGDVVVISFLKAIKIFGPSTIKSLKNILEPDMVRMAVKAEVQVLMVTMFILMFLLALL